MGAIKTYRGQDSSRETKWCQGAKSPFAPSEESVTDQLISNHGHKMCVEVIDITSDNAPAYIYGHMCNPLHKVR